MLKRNEEYRLVFSLSLIPIKKGEEPETKDGIINIKGRKDDSAILPVCVQPSGYDFQKYAEYIKNAVISLEEIKKRSDASRKAWATRKKNSKVR